MPGTGHRQEVVVVDFDMSFGSMVGFMVKWALAAIPAFMILVAIGILTMEFFRALVEAFARA